MCVMTYGEVGRSNFLREKKFERPAPLYDQHKGERMLIVGYPVSYETACELFGVLYNTENDPHGHILQATVEKTGLEFHTIDKNVNIIGLQIKEVAKLWEFTSVDESIGIIMAHKLKFVELVKKAGINTSEMVIERMEDEPIVVKNPPPYLITV